MTTTGGLCSVGAPPLPPVIKPCERLTLVCPAPAPRLSQPWGATGLPAFRVARALLGRWIRPPEHTFLLALTIGNAPWTR